MLKISGLLLCVLALTACQDDSNNSNSSADGTEADPVLTSPLIDTDRDRLWMVLREGPGVVLPCKAYYENPEDPRNSGRKAQCTVWELNTVDHLKINGFPTIEVAHVRDPALFDWWQQYWRDIRECQSSLDTFHPDRIKCDPYSYEIKYGKGREAWGIKQTGNSSLNEYRPSKLGEDINN